MVRDSNATCNMIRDIAELLECIRRKESELLKKYEIKQPTIIGSMYEGLTKKLLNRALPSNMDLRVVSGLIVNKKGKMSRQIDCMLVHGPGEQIPYTNSFKYQINRVIAVIEVKKKLFSKQLEESYANLLSVRRISEPRIIQLSAVRNAFRMITGRNLPAHDKIDRLPLNIAAIYHTLVVELLNPVRIIFGYQGFSNEYSLRERYVKYLTSNINEYGHGPISLPNLIVCRTNSLIKLNGMPYVCPMIDDNWPVIASYGSNPLLILIELIWTRLTYLFDITSEIFGDDLQIEVFNPFLFAECVKRNNRIGWIYHFLRRSHKDLKSSTKYENWQPAFLSLEQFVSINMLCKKGYIELSDEAFVRFVTSRGLEVSEFVSSLVATNLVTLEGTRLELLTDQCQAVILPDGSYVAAENKSGRLTRWVDHFMVEWKKKLGTLGDDMSQ